MLASASMMSSAGRIGSNRRDVFRAAGVSIWALACAMACSAVYPETAPPLKTAADQKGLVPPPPPELLYIAFEEATIPERTRDGRQWDRLGGNAPDPFAQLFVDDRELIKTPVQSNTLKPTWPDQIHANYRVPKGKKIRVELWDSNAINNRPICVKNVINFHESAEVGALELRCDSGARVRLKVEPAHAKVGLGFFYELRTQSVRISRIFAESPASRLGLAAGDEILEIEGKKVDGMEKGEAQSLINANAQSGVKLVVRGGGKTREVLVKEGPVYPLDTERVTF